MSDSPACDVYAKQLFGRGEGYPLWCPEAVDMEIADVGYLRNGKFNRLFNAEKDASHPIHQEFGVPAGFQRLAGSVAFGRQPTENAISPGPLGSSSLKEIEFDAHVGSDAAGIGCKFKCTKEEGAILVLKDPASRRASENLLIMQNYMARNISSWIDFANNPSTLGLGIELDEIRFVIGVVKTTQWVVSAIRGHQERSAQLSVRGEFGSTMHASISGSVMSRVEGSCTSRSGPPRANHHNQRGGRSHHNHPSPSHHQSVADRTEETNLDRLPEDQCIFFHFFQMKKRLLVFPKVMRAAAEPRDPSCSDDDDFVVEQVPSYHKPYDPVGYVLDYILENSAADCAIASDYDLSALCADSDIPEDIPALLRAAQPQIEVTEHGLGLLLFKDKIRTQQSIGQSSSLVHALDSSLLIRRTDNHDADADTPAKQTLVPQALYVGNDVSFNPEPPVIYVVNGRRGIPLTNALKQDFTGLEKKEDAAFKRLGTSKLSIRIGWPGYNPYYSRQITINSAEKRNSTSLSELARLIAKETQRFIDDNANTTGGVREWRLGSTAINMNTLLLTEVRHVSKGSVQPFFAVVGDDF